jgi:hypothetical protein
MIDPFHIHPRSKRTAKSPYKPLFKPLVPVKAGTSKARKAGTYRGHPDHVRAKLPTRYVGVASTGKYTPDRLRTIRAEKGVGRPVASMKKVGG